MADKVGKFDKRGPWVWCCAECNCSTFKLLEGGVTECAACGLQGAENGEWIKELPEPSGPVKEVLPNANVISFGDVSPSIALRMMMERVDADSLVALIAIEENGRVRSWGGIDTADRAAWLDRRLVDARELLTKCVPKSED